MSSFNGELFITSASGGITYDCGTQILVKNIHNATLRFFCPISALASNSFIVRSNQSVEIRADYVSPLLSGRFFYHCLGLQQNGKYVFTQKYYVLLLNSDCPWNKVTCVTHLNMFVQQICKNKFACILLKVNGEEKYKYLVQ